MTKEELDVITMTSDIRFIPPVAQDINFDSQSNFNIVQWNITINNKTFSFTRNDVERILEKLSKGE